MTGRESAGERRARAERMLAALAPAAREALLIRCWSSHDARWFMAVAREYGMGAANRLNKLAAHELGKTEAKRIVAALGLPAPTTLDEVLIAQEAMIALLGPDLLEYEVSPAGAEAYRVCIRRCFAHDNVRRAGVADEYECGIFARVAGWLEGLGVACRIEPGLDTCLQARGLDCTHTLRITRLASVGHS